MKKIEDIFDKVSSYNNLWYSFRKVNRGKNKLSKDSKVFCLNLADNFFALLDDLKNENTKPTRYYEFTITKPKERLIYAPDFESKIIQIAINNILMPELEKVMIKDSYASISGRGFHKAADKIQHNMRCAKRKWGNSTYTVKLDIKKFFYNIDREILKEIFKKFIGEEKMLNLLYKITDSASVMGEKGLPLGNTVSQLSANLYLNEFDHFIKRHFGIRYYVRYMDDIIIQVESKEKAKEVVKEAERFLNERLNLELNKNKTKVQPIKDCVNAVGYKIWTTHKKIRLSSIQTFRKIIAEEDDLYVFENRIASCLGSLTKASHYNLILDITSNIKGDKRRIVEDVYFKITGLSLYDFTLM